MPQQAATFDQHDLLLFCVSMSLILQKQTGVLQQHNMQSPTPQQAAIFDQQDLLLFSISISTDCKIDFAETGRRAATT